jgi:hypothetical protein
MIKFLWCAIFYLAGVNEFMLAISVAQEDGARPWGNFHVETVFFPLSQFRLTRRPRQVIGMDGLEFVASAPSPHTFARLRAANPVIQISFPSGFTIVISKNCSVKSCFSYCR